MTPCDITFSFLVIWIDSHESIQLIPQKHNIFNLCSAKRNFHLTLILQDLPTCSCISNNRRTTETTFQSSILCNIVGTASKIIYCVPKEATTDIWVVCCKNTFFIWHAKGRTDRRPVPLPAGPSDRQHMFYPLNLVAYDFPYTLKSVTGSGHVKYQKSSQPCTWALSMEQF